MDVLMNADISWRCFHCDDVFTDPACAELHFGKYQTCDPICVAGAKRFREMEDQLEAFHNEMDPSSKAFYELGSRHHQALMDTEQKAYDKGLRDANLEYQRADLALSHIRRRLRNRDYLDDKPDEERILRNIESILMGKSNG